ncbi:MAG: hypothetical protein ABSA03_01805 [Streptosporangiaceae bacterium]|jgi:hypothetical protein
MDDEQASEQRPATGDLRVDEALADLDELAGLPVTEHPPVFERVHGRLREVLGELDTGPEAELSTGPGGGLGTGPGGGAGSRPGR